MYFNVSCAKYFTQHALISVNNHMTQLADNELGHTKQNKRTMMVLYRSPEQTALQTYC